MRITAEVISCSGGSWSACWSDVIARMVAVQPPISAFERQFSAKSRHENARFASLMKAELGHSEAEADFLHPL